MVEVGAVSQKQVLSHGDGGFTDLAVAFEFLEAVAVVFQSLGTPETFVTTGGDRFVEQPFVVLFPIDSAAGNSLGRHRPHELIAGQTVEMGGIVAEGIEMPDRPAVVREPHRGDAGNVREVRGEVIGTASTEFGFLDEFIELESEKDCLGLGHPVIVAAGEIAGALVGAAGAAAVMIGIAFIDEFLA